MIPAFCALSSGYVAIPSDNVHEKDPCSQLKRSDATACRKFYLVPGGFVQPCTHNTLHPD